MSDTVKKLRAIADTMENGCAGPIATPGLLRLAADELQHREEHYQQLAAWVQQGEHMLQDANHIPWFRLGVWWSERPWRKRP